jgi:hypothetical protein
MRCIFAKNLKVKTMKKGFLLNACLLLLSGFAFSQIREIPKAVEETFANQYKGASNIEFKDQLTSVDVHFDLDGERMIASYSNKGLWKETQKEMEFEMLPADVKDGYEKSKFAGREQYRLKAKKNDVEKKYLYFNPKGRLLRETVTL